MTETPAIDPIPLDDRDQALLLALLGASEAEFAARHFHPYANLFPLMDEAESDALGEAMAANGQRDKIVMYQGRILDGRNRAIQLRKRGMTIHLRQFDPEKEGEPLTFVIDANLRRRQLNESQRAMVAAKLANLDHGGTRGDALPQLPLGAAAPAPVTQEQAAEALNVSERSLRRAHQVQEEGVAELQAAVESGAVAVSAASVVAALPRPQQSELLATLPRDAQGRLTREAEREISKAAKEIRERKQKEKKERRAERERSLADRILDLPDVRAGVVVEDFEWDDEVYSRETGMDRHASNHYPTAHDAHTPEEIVERTRERMAIAADDCVLLQWTTVQHLWIALQVMALRGFAYKSHFAWDKGKIGKGFWNRNKHEVLLIGTRGNVVAPAPGTQFESLLPGERGEHSVKPDWQYEIAETYWPNVPKVELNARRARAGWIGWGLDAPAEAQHDITETEAEEGAARSSMATEPSAGDDTGGCAPETGEPAVRHAASSEPASLACRAGDAGSLPPITRQLTPEEKARREAILAEGLPLHASDVRADVDASLYDAPHELVTLASYPRLYEAFELISHDSGAGAGHPQYPVPQGIEELAVIEAVLADLDDDELETFCIGDQDDAWAIARNSEELVRARKLLDRFFEGFTDPASLAGGDQPALSMET